MKAESLRNIGRHFRRHLAGMDKRLRWTWSALAVLGVAAAVFLLRPGQDKARASADAQPAALPSVAVARVDREDVSKEVTIPAEFRPYVEVEYHAKVSGYVDRMNVDFGDEVKRNQILATLFVPELQAQLDNATATEEKAEADYTNADLLYSRLAEVNKNQPNLVAQQDLDTARAKSLSTLAAIAAARAEVERYRTLTDYTNITSPFDGVITWRYADPGTLIQAGTSSDTQSMPLLRISDNYLLRLDVPVSVEYVKDMHKGDPVEVRVESLGGRSFTAAITRFTDKVALDTRTMITEVEVPNPKLELMPGMYATVVLKVENRPQALTVPMQAIAEGKTQTVYVVSPEGEVEERTVTLGVETPTKYEVLSGLKEGELVMIGDRSQVHPGSKVETKLVDLAAAP
ncbi:MAG: efflux RND transporter periplasmic adaptor subunit [Verrucomicrobiota bacterium]|jgi:RND family efflux transporter MFP subunit